MNGAMKRIYGTVIVLLFAVGISAIWSAPPNAPGGVLLVANKGEHTLGIVDPSARKQVADIPENGVTGHEVIASPDGKTAYVPIYGNSGVGKPGTDGTNMVAIDIASRKIVGNLDFGHGVRPHCAQFGPKNGLLYVSTELENSISIIDPKTLKIIGTVPTGQTESHMFVISHDGSRAYTECRTWHGLGSGPECAQDALGDPHLRHDPANRHLHGRQDGIYLRPDQTAFGCDSNRFG
jgi:YVTN family beta-propeller protein